MTTVEVTATIATASQVQMAVTAMALATSILDKNENTGGGYNISKTVTRTTAQYQ